MCEIRNYTLNSFGLFFHPYVRYVPLYGIILFHIDCHNNIPRHDSDEFFPLTHTHKITISIICDFACVFKVLYKCSTIVCHYTTIIFFFFYGMWGFMVVGVDTKEKKIIIIM